MKNNPPVDVACLVLTDDAGRVFAARRPPDKRLGGLWEFPGGKIEPDENPEVALRRELLEELNLEVGPLVPMRATSHTYDFATIRLWPLLARCRSRPLSYILREHTEARWVHTSEAAQLAWAPADIPVLQQLNDLIHA